MYPMPGNWRDENQIPHVCQAEFDGGARRDNARGGQIPRGIQRATRHLARSARAVAKRAGAAAHTSTDSPCALERNQTCSRDMRHSARAGLQHQAKR